jgi:hypothetical protein
MTEGRWVGWVDHSRLVQLEQPIRHEKPPSAPPPGPNPEPQPTDGTSQLTDALRNLEQPGKGPLLALVGVAVTVLTSLILWPVLQIPGDLLNALVPSGDCVGQTPGTFGMYACSAGIGLLQLLGGIAALILVIAFRSPLQAQMKRVLPSGSSSLVTPVLTTALFGLFYAPTHADTASQTGIVSQRLFPAAVGLLAFGGVRFAGPLASRFSGAISVRDRFPWGVRLAVAIGIPIVLAYTTMNQDRVTGTAMKEQVVILSTMLFGYGAFLPVNGDISSVLNRLMGGTDRWLGRLFRRKQQPTDPTIEGSTS